MEGADFVFVVPHPPPLFVDLFEPYILMVESMTQEDFVGVPTHLAAFAHTAFLPRRRVFWLSDPLRIRPA